MPHKIIFFMNPISERPRTFVDLIQRAKNYLTKVSPAISGQNGHGQLYTAAVALTVGFKLSEADALSLLKSDYNTRCQPPWTDAELIHKCREAVTKPHDRQPGWLLGASAGRE